jgi:hypothetical protein
MSGAGGDAGTLSIATDIVGAFQYDHFYGHYFVPWTDNPLQQFCNWDRWVADKGSPPSQQNPNPDYVLCGIRNAMQTWIQGQTANFFCWYALPTPWEYLHRPPNGGQVCNPCTGLVLHTTSFPATQPAGLPAVEEQQLCYKALVEAADAMVGELLAALDAQAAPFGKRWYDTTTVILVGDNGTPDIDSPPLKRVNFYWPPQQTKGTVYEGGIRVPLIIAGRDVAAPQPRISYTPVMVADLYPTVNALMGAANTSVPDGLSLVPILNNTGSITRTGVYAEWFNAVFVPAGGATVRNQATQWRRAATDGQYKVIKTGTRCDGFIPPWSWTTQYLKYIQLSPGGIVEFTPMGAPLPQHQTLEQMIDGICP